MWSEDVAPKEAPSLGVLRAEAAFLGNKEGLTAHSSLARIVLPIVLPRMELQGNESGQAMGCLAVETITQSCCWISGGGGTLTRLRSRRMGGLAQAGSFR